MWYPVMSTATATFAAVTIAERAKLSRTLEGARYILFFDGHCGLCNKSVDFVSTRDLKGVFQFAPLQGETAQHLLMPEDLRDLRSLVLLADGKVFRHSSAVVKILWCLGNGWKAIAALLWLIPRPFRDLGYRLVARNRYRIFGHHEACRRPTMEERSKFLP